MRQAKVPSQENYLCNSCKFYYDIHKNENFPGHEFCAKGVCRCCVYDFGNYCDEFSKGNVPGGKEIGGYRKEVN